MRVAVFGATGSVGSLVVAALSAAGHDPVIVSRAKHEERFEGSAETLIGNVTDPAFIASVMMRCDGLIFCIGQRLKNPKNLFSTNLSPANIRTQVVDSITRVIGSDHSKRFVYLSAFGVGDELKKHALPFRAVLRLSSLGASYEDHNQAERLVRSSNTTWTIVRAPGLTDKDEVIPLTDARGKWSSFMSATKKSVAKYLVQTYEDVTLNRETVTVIEA